MCFFHSSSLTLSQAGLGLTPSGMKEGRKKNKQKERKKEISEGIPDNKLEVGAVSLLEKNEKKKKLGDTNE